MIRNDFELTVDQKGVLLDSNDSFSDIAWHNIQTAAELYNVQFVSSACLGWLRANPAKRTVDLEKELRTHNVPVHLIATPHKPKEGLVLKPLFPDSVTPTYELLYSCRPDKYAIEEIEGIWSNYDENVEHLPEAGVLCGGVSEGEYVPPLLHAEEGENVENSGLKALRTNDHTNAMMYNYVKLSYHQVTQAELGGDLNDQMEHARKTFGQEPEARVIGMAGDGSAVTAYVIDGKLISELGTLIGAGKTKVIHVQNQSTWNW